MTNSDTIQDVEKKSVFDFGDGNGPVPAHRHVNGEGWVADTATVEDTAFVGPDAVVYDNATVSGKPEVLGKARVHGKARVYDSAKVYDEAEVFGNALVYGKAEVYGEATVCGNAKVSCNAKVYDNARVCAKMSIEATKDYLTVGPIGSRDAMLTFGYGNGGEIYVATGCFSGTLEEFEAAVRKTHGDNYHAQGYMEAVRFFKVLNRKEGSK